VIRWQSDFLPSLAEGGGLGAGIGRVDGSAGQGHLAGVRAELAVPNGEGNDEVPGSIRIDREQGCGRARRREVAALESAPRDLAVEGPWQQSFVERDRSRRARQRIGQLVLPAGRLA